MLVRQVQRACRGAAKVMRSWNLDDLVLLRLLDRPHVCAGFQGLSFYLHFQRPRGCSSSENPTLANSKCCSVEVRYPQLETCDAKHNLFNASSIESLVNS